MKCGYLRETEDLAQKAGIDPVTKLPRTGLETYLKAIFPNVVDWEHDKCFPFKVNGKSCRKRPDYRSDSLKLIIEFDGLPHYQNPDVIIRDNENTKFYESFGYSVIRIPFFIQLTRKTVKKMFNVDVSMDLFPETFYSLTPEDRNTPAYLCPMGIKRMAEDFKKYQEQYKANRDHLEKYSLELSGLDYLEKYL